MIKMEDIYPAQEEDIGEFYKKMHLKVEEDGDPVTSLVNDVRVIMFVEKRHVDPHYDGPR